MIRHAIVIIALAFVTRLTAAQPDAPMTTLPDDVTRQIDALLDEWNAETPGCALAVYGPEGILYARGVGRANLEHPAPITPTTVFRIASTSKQFTAACIALLHLDGVISLDAPIQTWLPEIPAHDPPITVRHLVHHTSGLRDYLTLAALAGVQHDNYDNAFILDLLSRQRALNFNPGDEELYSNTNYVLLALIVQRATGLSLREFAHERLFTPLGMSRTHFNDDHTEIIPGRATGYAPADTGWIIAETDLEIIGDGGLFTTVTDLARWHRNTIDHAIGGPELRTLLETTATLNDGAESDYAFGLMITEHRGSRLIMHGGAFVGFRAEYLRFPEHGLGVACLANTADAQPTALAMQVAEICLADRLGPAEPDLWDQSPDRPETVTLDPDLLATYHGNYYETSMGVPMTIALDGDDTVMRLMNLRFPLLALSEREFVTFEGPIRLDIGIEPAPAGGGHAVSLRVPGQGVFRFLPRREPTTPLAAYQGLYDLPELNSRYDIWAGDSTLLIRIGSAEPVAMTPVSADVFTGDLGVLTFHRADDDTVTGAALNAGRVRDLALVRLPGEE